VRSVNVPVRNKYKGGRHIQRELLEAEGIAFDIYGRVNMEECRYFIKPGRDNTNVG
jgi:alkylated DNA nucleotide flippase Atl1